VFPGEKLSDILRKASMKYGMPMTKSIRYYCPFCLEAVGSLVKHTEEKHKSMIKYVEGGTPTAEVANDDGDDF